MPGIAGVIGRLRREEGVHKVEEMLLAMSHERFYLTGLYANEQLGAYVGWVVHPNSFCDCMPVKSRDGRTVLLVDGEVFNSSEKFGVGQRFDATYLARLYDELGDAFFPELNGTFSGIVLDSAARTVKLF